MHLHSDALRDPAVLDAIVCVMRGKPVPFPKAGRKRRQLIAWQQHIDIGQIERFVRRRQHAPLEDHHREPSRLSDRRGRPQVRTHDEHPGAFALRRGSEYRPKRCLGRCGEWRSRQRSAQRQGTPVDAQEQTPSLSTGAHRPAPGLIVDDPVQDERGDGATNDQCVRSTARGR